ncbi:Histidine-containing phosphotransfer protein [Heracleum sosnowskyi]|uniref:Histidine-containing phosphotransfer protein n=1 Tax=Heracleum sosnowskyi TaxID=360622 RepID=A0AAD8HIF2_9APIA|nr:Histidine-containing phosphotransfer protein [Heracleum sosnowskyi]
MDRNQMQTQIAYLRKSFFDEGFLDEQFMQLEDLQDDANPNFVEEIVASFYGDSVRLLRNLEMSLEKRPFDFCKLENYMHLFKSSSSSIGAIKVKRECTRFQDYCKAGNAEGCISSYHQVKQEHAILRRKLETYFKLARQAA